MKTRALIALLLLTSSLPAWAAEEEPALEATIEPESHGDSSEAPSPERDEATQSMLQAIAQRFLATPEANFTSLAGSGVILLNDSSGDNNFWDDEPRSPQIRLNAAGDGLVIREEIRRTISTDVCRSSDFLPLKTLVPHLDIENSETMDNLYDLYSNEERQSVAPAFEARESAIQAWRLSNPSRSIWDDELAEPSYVAEVQREVDAALLRLPSELRNSYLALEARNREGMKLYHRIVAMKCAQIYRERTEHFLINMSLDPANGEHRVESRRDSSLWERGFQFSQSQAELPAGAFVVLGKLGKVFGGDIHEVGGDNMESAQTRFLTSLRARRGSRTAALNPTQFKALSIVVTKSNFPGYDWEREIKVLIRGNEASLNRVNEAALEVLRQMASENRQLMVDRQAQRDEADRVFASAEADIDIDIDTNDEDAEGPGNVEPLLGAPARE
jgi:hypothetical protein